MTADVDRLFALDDLAGAEPVDLTAPATADPDAYEAARRQLVPTLLDVRCSSSTHWPAGKAPGLKVAALSEFPHDTHRVAFAGRAEDEPYTDEKPSDCEPASTHDGANAISSRISDGLAEGLHTVAIDLDVPARLVPSSTPGHSHLYVDQPMTWAGYSKLLAVLAEVGLIEPGYEAASQRRGHTTLRLPWVAKRPADASSS